jgi:GTP-binding protein
MIIRSVRFLSGSPDLKGCPRDSRPEFAFIGRSNVGKSSLINLLASQKNLARISSDPGKTRMINHFLVNETFFIVDLPGYGYAKVSKSIREKFQGMINNYIQKRENLYCLFVLIDSRLEPQSSDIQFINWLGENSVPFSIVFTKTDKITPSVLVKNTAKFKEVLLQQWDELPDIFITSSEKRKGRDELLQYMEKAMQPTL